MTGDRAIRADARATLVARVVGAVFIPAGIVKFAAYGWELDNFRAFGLPAAPAWVAAAGLIEVGGGVLLLRRRAVVPAAALLATTMAIAIAVSGIGHGDVVPSLTFAPALLLGLLFVLRRAAAPRPDGHLSVMADRAPNARPGRSKPDGWDAATGAAPRPSARGSSSPHRSD